MKLIKVPIFGRNPKKLQKRYGEVFRDTMSCQKPGGYLSTPPATSFPKMFSGARFGKFVKFQDFDLPGPYRTFIGVFIGNHHFPTQISFLAEKNSKIASVQFLGVLWTARNLEDTSQLHLQGHLRKCFRGRDFGKFPIFPMGIL